MAARIPLTKTLTAGNKSPSIQIRLADPPYLFVVPLKGTDGVTVTGTVSIENSVDTQPPLQGMYTDRGVSDANAQWETIISAISPGDQVEWKNPLSRIRVNGTNLTGGTAQVYMLEGIRGLKTTKKAPRRAGKQYQSRNGY